MLALHSGFPYIKFDEAYALCHDAIYRLLPQVHLEHREQWTAAQCRAFLPPLEVIASLLIDARDGRPSWGSGFITQSLVVEIQINRAMETDVEKPTFWRDNSSLPKPLTEWSLLVLETLKRVGDEREIPLLEQILQIKPTGPRIEKVQCACRELLPFVCLRGEERRQARTLLRSSASLPADTPEEMLRPAAAHDVTPPNEMLRPTD